MCHTRGPSDQTIDSFQINIQTGGLIGDIVRLKGKLMTVFFF